MNSPNLLWDPLTRALCTIIGDFDFFDYIQARATNNGISRLKLQGLREKIQETLLLEYPDDCFSPQHHEHVDRHGFTDEYRGCLLGWDRRFKNVMSHSNCSNFKLL